MATKNVLVTKNKEANELRSQADALRSKLADPATQMTVDEVNTTTQGIRSLEMRAQAVAEFTVEAEIGRQGGEEEVRSFKANAENDEDLPEEVRAIAKRQHGTAAQLIRKLTNEVQNEFGDVRSMLRVVTGREQPTTKQERFLKTLSDQTRSITGDTNGGGYLLPLTQVQEIFSLANQQPGVIQVARTYNVPGRSLRIPYLVQDTGTTTLNRPMAGEIANVSIIGEGSTKSTREPTFGQRLLTVYKYAAIAQLGDELLADDFTGELPTEVTNAVGQQAINATNEDCTINGTGSSMPAGAFNATGNTALIAVNRQTAGTFTAQDAFSMYEKHTHGPKSMWLISRRVLSKLFAMQQTNNTLVTWIPNLRDKPQMLLLGLPVVVSDLMAPLGTFADVGLVNGDFYAYALRQALTVESSRDYAFVQDLTTYRFIVRAGGLPIPTSTYAYKINSSGNKVDEHSPFVALDLVAS